MNFALLNAFRRDAKGEFLVNGELLIVANEDWVECVKGAFTFRVVSRIDCPES